MNDTSALIETQARHQIHERVARARRPQVPAAPRRHRFAERLRRIADRIDNEHSDSPSRSIEHA